MPKVFSPLCRAALALVIAAAAGCAGREPAPPVDPAQADRFLMERGTAELKEGHWLEAREYFTEIVDNYPGSPFRADAKLGVGDTYLGEGSAQALVLAANEFREFLTFYPRHERTDYAQYKLAMTFFEQMHGPQRDQTPTRQALAEFEVFFQRYPLSALMPEVKQKWRIARDRLSEHSYSVGFGYYRRGLYFAAIPRFREVINEDPDFSRIDRVYYHLAESLRRSDNSAEAIPLFARVVGDYQSSEYFDDAQKRLEELQAQ